VNPCINCGFLQNLPTSLSPPCATAGMVPEGGAGRSWDSEEEV
jgi:hypothetical protein